MLLRLEAVSKSRRDGRRSRPVLQDVHLEVYECEYVVVWGLRCSGRSTLLRVAAGVERPDRGRVWFEGRELRHANDALGDGIGFCQKHVGSGECRNVRDFVTMGLLARGTHASRARGTASRVLERCGVRDLAGAVAADLTRAEVVRVTLARTLALDPRLLVVDEPTSGVELGERDPLLLLLRSIADDGISVLASTGESAGLSGADRTLVISSGLLRGEIVPELAHVVPLRRTA
jgi:putative ABC transport system ATP-binding protein